MTFSLRLLVPLSLAMISGLALGQNTGLSKPGVDPFDVQGEVNAILILPDKSYLVGGTLSAPSAHPNVTHLSSTGALIGDSWSTAFPGGPDSTVRSLVLSTNNGNGTKVYMAGNFTTIGSTTVYKVARMNLSGTRDGGFTPPEFQFNDQIDSVIELPDGKVLIGGFFSTVGGNSRSQLARLNINGTLDTTFNVQPDDQVHDLLLLPDGSVIVSGSFDEVNGQSISKVFKLTPAGAVDTTFSAPTIGDSVFAADFQNDGKIIIGGAFVNLDVDYNYAARLNTNGSLDTSYDSARHANNTILAVHVQNDQRIVVGGIFDEYSAAADFRSYIQRLMPDGTIDTSFRPNPGAGDEFRGTDGPVQAIQSSGDGDLYIGGSFFEAGGSANNSTAILTTSFIETDPFDDYLIAAGVPVGMRDPEDDPDGDGQPNLLEYAYDSDPNDATDFAVLSTENTTLTGAQINAFPPNSGLGATDLYYTSRIRLPKDPKGVTLQVKATLNLPNFSDNSATMNAYGSPTSSGAFNIQRYYALPKSTMAPKLFWRIEASR